jgi:tRNA A-37 threonylcarbamoyl transferase component Bud32
MNRPPLLTIESLRESQRQPQVPFCIALPDGERLTVCRLFRVLPGKRLAGEASWKNRRVFAKLFVGKEAVRHGERERKGIEALQSKKVPTPSLIAAMPTGGRGYVVISEFLDGAQTLDDQISTELSPASLAPAMGLLARLHAAGLVHRDLHFGNFLEHDKRLLLIDGDAVRTAMSAMAFVENLALLLAQLKPALDVHRPELLAAYGRAVDRRHLATAISACRATRLRRFLGKTLRECTQFAVTQDGRRFVTVLREERETLQSLLLDPDAAMTRGQLLKDGGTCTVARVTSNERQLVVKRYNIKHWRHALSRAWRPSRAWHSWREAHRLAFHGIATPQPLAMIEERFGPLRGRAFLVTAHCAGRSLVDSLDPDNEPDPVLGMAIKRLFEALCELRITHGDLKASNLLWQDDEIFLIDLDAMVQHRAQSTFAAAWRRDRARFVRNWPAGSALAQWLDRELPAA